MIDRKSWPHRAPDTLHPDEFLDRLSVPGLVGVYALGCFARYQTLYAQQVRAINLADSLAKVGLLAKDTRVVIVGAGVGGMTAAVAARMLGGRVTLLEAHDALIPFQRGSTSRYLHPYAYDWPFIDRHDRAPLPTMNWTAGPAASVFGELEATFERERQRLGGIDVRLGLRLNAVGQTGDDIVVSMASTTSADVASQFHGHIVILALGFGREVRYPDIPGYWDGDGLASIEDAPRRWLVSGSGDGALTDLVRLIVQDFNHQELVDALVTDSELTAELAEHIKTTDTMREAFARVVAGRRQALMASIRLRSDRAVHFCAPRDSYLESPESCILNRFLVYLLEPSIEFQDGRLAGIPAFDRSSDCPYRVRFVQAAAGAIETAPVEGTFHGVIPRHGVEASEIGAERVPRVWSASDGLLDIWQRCAGPRQRWRAESKFDDRTRVRQFGPDFGVAAATLPPSLSQQSHPQRLRVAIVSSTTPAPPGARPLADLVPDTLDAVEKKVKQALQLARDETFEWERTSISCEPGALGRSWFEHAARQLCRADVVFFDITDYEPLVMTLLGVRAAARRGVNILCTYDRRSTVFWSQLPFNIKEMQPIGIGPSEADASKSIGRTLVDALARQRSIPGYTDVPGFDALRRSVLSDRFRTPVRWEDEALWLCSFSDEYHRQRNADTIRDKIRVAFGDDIELRRLTDIVSTELASQKLFDAIRRYHLCLADFTQWSSNVFFEFGVRLAAHPRCPVCLTSDRPEPVWAAPEGSSPESLAQRQGRHRVQVEWLERSFAAIRYRVDQPFDLREVRRRIERMDAAEENGQTGHVPTFGAFPYDFVYRLVANEARVEQQGLRPPVDLLRQASAEILGEASQRRLDIATLYADRNADLNQHARGLALDYHVAAWRYARAEAEVSPDDGYWLGEKTRLAVRIRNLLESRPERDPRKTQLLKELAAHEKEGPAS